MEKLTAKERKFLVELLDRNYALQALDSYYNENDEKEFKKHYGISFKVAEKIYIKLIKALK
jgi:hypothetical protein